jgi:hypothetical protein
LIVLGTEIDWLLSAANHVAALEKRMPRRSEVTAGEDRLTEGGIRACIALPS